MTPRDPAAVADSARVARLFHELAPEYDSSGVGYFGPMARRLVGLLAPQPGERALDVGCGRGAASFPLAEAVGPGGAVTAADLVPAMVDAVDDDARRRGLDNLNSIVLDASAPPVPRETYDLVVAAAVLHLLPDPRKALARWLRLLKPGGRIGLTTLGARDPTWSAVDSLFAPYRPTGSLGPGGSSDHRGDRATVLLVSCGAAQVHTTNEPVRVQFRDAEHWRAFTLTTEQRADWHLVPPEERDRLYNRARFLLESARTADGDIVLTQQVHYTVGRRPLRPRSTSR